MLFRQRRLLKLKFFLRPARRFVMLLLLPSLLFGMGGSDGDRIIMENRLQIAWQSSQRKRCDTRPVSDGNRG